MALEADSGPVTSVSVNNGAVQRTSLEEIQLTCLQASDGLVLSLGAVTLGDNGRDAAMQRERSAHCSPWSTEG